MSDVPSGVLFSILIVLIVLSGLFSSSETGLMSLNRYRLRHLADKGHRGARLTQKLLARPDRLLGLILLGNNFVNIVASSLATILALRYYDEAGLAVATGILTLVILIFAEVAPKTLAALHPERIAFPSAYVYTLLSKVMYPFVWLVNVAANSFLRLLRVDPSEIRSHSLSAEELRAVLHEADERIPAKHQDMLLSILNLEHITVEDIMVPRNEITGIDLGEDWSTIKSQLMQTHRTRLPIYTDTIDSTIGILHMRKVIGLIASDELNRESLEKLIREPYFIPESTSLNRQLLNFQKGKRRTALVVDEYGEIQGLVTLEDILEEIVGEFTTDSSISSRNIHEQEDGSYLIDGSAHIREINRTLNTNLPTEGPKTLNGLILEHLEIIPEAGTSIKIADCPIEITKSSKNAVKAARLRTPEPPSDVDDTVAES